VLSKVMATKVSPSPKQTPNERKPQSLQEFLTGLAKIGEQIPKEVRATIPRDAARNVDHYLYGAPKEDE
jgi:hypothetical protein